MFPYRFILLAFLVLNFQISTSRKPSIYNDVYDFIVVGGGTSGSAISSRLVQAGHSVLVIEAGEEPNEEMEIPALSTKYMTDPKTATIYQTVPQQNAARILNGTVSLIVGKGLSGSSGINWMFLNRGSPHDYNSWARMINDESWNYNNLLKYFKKLENYLGDNPTDQRGYDGPISVSTPRYSPAISEWLEAGQELNYPIADPNGSQIESFGKVDFSQKRGRRVHSYKGYLEHLLNSPNLQILTNTTATKIIFEERKAVGVEFERNGEISYAKAEKEIILSSGVIGSAALLMRSGIGPRNVLRNANIPVTKHLNVGRNFHDHPAIATMMIFNNQSAIFDAKRDLNWENWKIYESLGDGPYSSYLGTGGQAFLTSNSLAIEEKLMGWPNIQLMMVNTNDALILPVPPTFLADVKEGEVPVYWVNWVTRPKSRGALTLDPEDINKPVLDFQYLTHPDDMQAMIDGIKMLVKICEETEAFRRIGCRIPSTPLPACNHLKFRSNSYWTCYARELTITGLHPVGTCKMGAGNDPSAVVDNQLRVIGMDRLRVVDASIMPAVTNANTQTVAYVIAEKAADMIRAHWQNKNQKVNYRHGWDRLRKSHNNSGD